MNWRITFYGFLLLVLGRPVYAEDPAVCAGCVPVGEWQLSVGLGLGVRMNPLYDGDNTPLIVLPELSYYGERFFLKNFDLGYTLLEDKRHQLNLLFTPSRDQMYFNCWDPLNFTDSGSITTSPIATESIGASYQVNVFNDAGDSLVSGVPSPGVGDTQRAETTQVQGIENLVLNGSVLEPNVGTRIIEGRQGNAISVGYDETSGAFSISGLAAGDELNMRGSEVSIAEGESSPRELEAGEYQQPSGDAAINIGVSPRPAPAEADYVNRGDVDRRKFAGMMGVEYLLSFHWLDLHFQALSDVTGVHGGSEVRFAAMFPWEMEDQMLAFTWGLNYQSRDVLNYYYGVESHEAPSANLVYQPDSAGMSYMFRLDWQKRLNRHWSLRAMAQSTFLAEEIKHSPLVEKARASAIFIGGVYHF